MKTKMRLVFVLLVCAGVLEAATIDNSTSHTIMNVEDIAKPGCQSQCGDLKVPYPFGIQPEGNEGPRCFRDFGFDIICNTSTDPPKALIRSWKNIEIFDISDNELRVSNNVAEKCYNQSGLVYRESRGSTEVDGTPYSYSSANLFTVVGCDDDADFVADAGLRKGCGTTCRNAEEVDKDGCFGTGCCQVSFNIYNFFNILLKSYDNHLNVSAFNPCSYAFLGERNKFNYSLLSDLKDPNLKSKIEDTVPLVLDWVIDRPKNCSVAAQDPDTFACKHAYSYCVDTDVRSGGYRCSCEPGYEGNPYLSPGCKDIDECADPTKNDCVKKCKNVAGSYTCSCPGDHDGDGRKNGSGCVAKSSKFPLLKFILGMSFGFISLIAVASWIYFVMKKRKHAQSREKFFQQNGGLLLNQKNTSKEGVTIESSKLFTDEELKKATNNYASDRILGQGGYGIVYKGILPDQRVVAIKRSKIIDQSQIEQFINEMVILTQVNHRNVVKLMGCCLECEVPLLVYEFVSNGTLLEHVHGRDGGMPWLSWENRLRIAAESSGALAYLHSAASIPVIHRDVKLANILLDDNHVAKISDFGASRLVPLDQTQVTTLVQGTLGYLDPEYFHSGQLTGKSDVYSFGVVLAELLTGRKPISMDRSPEERNLATYFISSVNEKRLFLILEPRLVKEVAVEQLETAAQLVKRCLSLNSKDRPTMKEVSMEIERLRKSTKHPWTNQHASEETTSLIGHTEIQYSDLYEIQLSSYSNNGSESEQYNSSTISLLRPSNIPR
ncbi:hypothetical protein ACET3Z_019545 [Daucus carota]